jgi:TetR/AcrR family transcriptional regulator, regulator of cefoperazone and chloramphenicol sensitivity
MKRQPTLSQRGEITRQSLIVAAIEIFGRDGFHAANTRDIARRAGVNQALICYHFGSKEALYLAATEHIALQIRRRLAPLADEIVLKLKNIEDRNDQNHQTVREVYLTFLLRLSDALLHMLIDQDSSSWAGLILREQQSPGPAFDVLYNGIMKRLLHLTSYLAGKIRGIDPNCEEARLLAVTIFGQVVVFRASRAAVLKHMDWADFNTSELEMIQVQVRRNITFFLLHAEP